ncbi:hypothetical protein N7493_000695 [Penicillium malachiteum]|uniref:NWD NACHT-NTPase N-terminal domain-containing protein n=1 Tax=Penicillium malachiteum TaxID=1324776 RepID=A0AAD6HXH1_9EURO|nr:hypothetical protein N7493_000695 [Penicillium malachiteum]
MLQPMEISQWRVSLLGKDVKIREQSEKLAKFLLWSSPIVQSALSSQPYAALAWSGVALLLPLLTSGTAKNEAMLKGFNSIGDVQVYWEICERTYLQPSHRNEYQDLMKPLVKLYSHILEYQARVICHLSSVQLSRAWQNVAGWSDWDVARQPHIRSSLVSAGPACGKSVLSRALIDERRLSTQVTTSTICHFFFKDGDERRMHPTNSLCAIIHQLFMRDPTGSLIQHGLARHKSYGKNLAQNLVVLWDILIDCAGSLDTGELVCVIDALDECVEVGRRQLIGQLKKLYCQPGCPSNPHSKLKFLITSRPYHDLERSFKGFSGTTTYLHFDDPKTGPSTDHPEFLGKKAGEQEPRAEPTEKPTENEATQPIHGVALVGPNASPIPASDVPLECDLTSPELKEPSTENQLPKIPDIETPKEPLDEGGTTESYIQVSIKTQYDKNGFVDEKGYLVEIGEDGKPTSPGDATLFTALAVVALATGNCQPDEWETQNANTAIMGFLNVLLETSWGKTDFVPKGQIATGENHPIRHPEVIEWDKSGRSRPRPLSKDSFAPIVAACYYSYTCPNSSEEVRSLAQTLLTKWVKYLSEHRWMLHTNWSGTELQEVIYSTETVEKENQKLTVDGFMLWPHELYALKDCALTLFISQSIPILYLDSKKSILQSFEAAFKGFFLNNAAMFRDISKLKVGCSSTITKCIERILGLFPVELKHFPILDYIQSLFKQVLPWFDPEILVEFYAFAIVGFYTLFSKKDSDIGYTVWSFIIVSECRPVLIYWLLPVVSDVFDLIASRGNPNGIWAWIAHKKSNIDNQICVFGNNHINKWRYYASTKNYAQWLHGDANAILTNTIPVPQEWITSSYLHILWEGFKACIQAMIDDAVAKFKEVGKLEQQFVDLAGNTVLEVISQAEGFSRRIWKAGKQTSRLLHHLAGEVKYMAWDAVGGSLTHFMRWSKAQADLTMKLEDLVEFQLRDILSGSKAVWKWANGALDSFVKYAVTSINGTVADLQNWTIKQIRSVEDDLATDAENIYKNAVRDAVGGLTVLEKDGERLIRRLVFSGSTPGDIAKSAQFVMYQFRSLDAKIEQWDIDEAGPKLYRVWVNSTLAGAAPAENLVKSVERSDGGKFIIRFFKDGLEFGGQVVDKFGHELEKRGKGIGKGAQDVIGAIGGVLGGIHL